MSAISKQTELPSGWEMKKLSTCCIGKSSYGINAGAVEFSAELPRYLRITDIDDSGNFSNEKMVSVCNEQFENFILEDGDIVFVRTGATVGKTYLYNPKDGILVYAGFLIKFKTDPNKLLSKYLSLFTQSNAYWNWVKTVSMRSGQPGINAEEYGELKSPLPPLPEQRAIANILSTWDNAIQTTQTLISQKEEEKKWLMQNLLTGKKRLKGFSLSAHKAGGEWREFKYSDLLKVVKRPVDWDDDELYELISVRRRSGGIFLREALYGHQIMVKDLRTVNVGDFLFSKMQIVHGASALVKREHAGAKISGSYIAVVAKNSKLLSMEYLEWYSKLPFFYHQTLISSYGVHIEKMTFDFKSFLQLEIRVPSIQEQTAIAQVLQTADKEIELLKYKLEQQKLQKKGLMQVLLTGKVRVPHHTA